MRRRIPIRWFSGLNSLRWSARWPIKGAILGLTVLAVCYPFPRLLARQVSHLRNPNALVAPDAAALQPMLEELKLYKLHIDSNASLSLPHLVKLEFLFCPVEHLNKFLVVAPRLRQVIVHMNVKNKSLLGSFLQAAERRGVERVELYTVQDDRSYYRELAHSLKFQWSYVRVLTL